jgi:Flp pilus assembly protein TadB
MFKTSLVVWLVLLVLALTVVSFVTRFVEKRRLLHRFSKSLEGTVSVKE